MHGQLPLQMKKHFIGTIICLKKNQIMYGKLWAALDSDSA